MFGIGKTNLHPGVKLGKAPVKHDRRTLLFSRYNRELEPAPASYDWSHRLHSLGMLKNDALGDCTGAGVAHLIQAWTAFNGSEFVPTDDQTVAFYGATCGYDPADPSTDCGGNLLDVLKYWKKNGFAGHQIDGYVAINPKEPEEVRQSLYYFGGLYIGLQLPDSAQSQDVWDVPFLGARGKGTPGSWGGHCVANILDYDHDGLTTITWGALKKMTWRFFETYCDEAYCVLSPDWIDANGVSATGFDIAALEKDLEVLAL